MSLLFPFRRAGMLALLTFLAAAEVLAQRTVSYDESLYDELTYRSIGPYRGGRSAAVTGVPGQPFVFYFGATGGGVWKTTDAGQSWHNISDGFFGGSIGAVSVSTWDPNVIYVGGGEKTVRGNVSHGYGLWKSTDAGKSWKQVGLEDSRRISRIRIHPRDPDRVYAAVMGHLFGPNEERGVYRSVDGGATWERVLFVNDEVGAVDLVMDPTNPRILFASTWRIRRTPYSLESGGAGSGLWKSTDGGDTWTDITRNEGMPEGTVGIIGVTVSPANPERIWAIIEANDGGVFRSDDGGDTWTRINEDRDLRQRAWYYSRIYADTKNVDGVYVLNVSFWQSKDGGKTYDRIRTPHGDHHDLWVDPEEPLRMIVGDDGGAQVTLDGGNNWSTYHNQPTAQFYRVTTDDEFPYRIYGAQQDNSTVRIVHRSSGSGIGERDWEPTAGGESGHIAPHPKNADIVFGGSYGGSLTRMNHETGERRSVNVWPDNPMGHGAKDLRYRFQWNFPIFFSPHEPHALYAAGNVLFRSTDEGQSWEAISPDLTRNDSTKLGPSGGPITKDNTSIEYYATIFAAAESRLEAGVLWAGSDDGYLHVSRDGGASWSNVTPPRNIMPEWMQINSIELHPTEPGGLYVAGTRYKLDDFSPYLYRTTDYGASWERIDSGIDRDHFTRVIRADPARAGLLYAGTESGMYVSFDDGKSWSPFQLDLPIVPITDLAVKNNDLIVATQGRSFWVLDDLTPLHQLSDDVAQSTFWLYTPRPTYRVGGRRGESNVLGANPPSGVVLNYYFAEPPDSSKVHIRIVDGENSVIESFTPKSENQEIPVEKGMNRWEWDERYPDAERFDGLVMWAGSTTGPRAIPGTYRARLVVGDDSTEVPFELLKDPRSSATDEDLKIQFDFLITCRDKLSEAHEVIKNVRNIREQVDDVLSRVEDRPEAEEITASGKALLEAIGEVERALYQTKNRSGQDPLNYPIRLNNRLAALAGVASRGDNRPTSQAFEVRSELFAAIDQELSKFDDILSTDLPAFNDLVSRHNVPAVFVRDTAMTSSN